MDLAVRMMRRAISPRLATKRQLIVISSHPERAEVGAAAHFSVVRAGQGDADYGAGIPGVDDAVVPHPARREQRRGLLFQLVFDGFPVLLVGRLVERNAPRLR